MHGWTIFLVHAMAHVDIYVSHCRKLNTASIIYNILLLFAVLHFLLYFQNNKINSSTHCAICHFGTLNCFEQLAMHIPLIMTQLSSCSIVAIHKMQSRTKHRKYIWTVIPTLAIEKSQLQRQTTTWLHFSESKKNRKNVKSDENYTYSQSMYIIQYDAQVFTE